MIPGFSGRPKREKALASKHSLGKSDGSACATGNAAANVHIPGLGLGPGLDIPRVLGGFELLQGVPANNVTRHALEAHRDGHVLLPGSEPTAAAVLGGFQPAISPQAGLEGMLTFISRNKITEGRPIRSRLADTSGGKAAASMKWIQPSGPRQSGQGVEDEEQGIISAERTLQGGALLRVTLLAAGFVIGPSGSSVREIMSQTSADIRSQTDKARTPAVRPSRIFIIEGDWQYVVAALKVVYEAVDRYKELCEGRHCGQFVNRSQTVCGVEFSYQPPPRHLVPYAAALKGQNNRARQADARESHAAHTADVFANVRSALSMQQSLHAVSTSRQTALKPPRPTTEELAAFQMPAHFNSMPSMKYAGQTGTGSRSSTAQTHQNQAVLQDRWNTSGMDPLTTVAHVLAATSQTSAQAPASHPTSLPRGLPSPHSAPLQPLQASGTAFDQDPSLTPRRSAAKHAILPTFPRSPFSAHNPPGTSSRDPMDTDGVQLLGSGVEPVQGMYVDPSLLLCGPSRDSSLGSGGIPAFFEHQASGTPGSFHASALDPHALRRVLSGAGRRSVLSAASSLEDVKEADEGGDAWSEPYDMDMTTVPGTHVQPDLDGVGFHVPPQAHLLSTAFGTLAMQDGSESMDITNGGGIPAQAPRVPAAPPPPLNSAGPYSLPSGSLLELNRHGSGFSNRHGSQSTTPSPFGGSQAAGQEYPPTTGAAGQQRYLGTFESNALDLDASNSDAFDSSSWQGVQQPSLWSQSQQAQDAYNPMAFGLDPDLLHNVGLNPEDVMFDGPYNLGKAVEARRLRLMAEGPKPRQKQLAPSPRSIMEQRFSGGTISGGSTAPVSGRSRLAKETSGPPADQSLWSNHMHASTQHEAPQYFLPSNLDDSLYQTTPMQTTPDKSSRPLQKP